MNGRARNGVRTCRSTFFEQREHSITGFGRALVRRDKRCRRKRWSCCRGRCWWWCRCRRRCGRRCRNERRWRFDDGRDRYCGLDRFDDTSGQGRRWFVWTRRRARAAGNQRKSNQAPRDATIHRAAPISTRTRVAHCGKHFARVRCTLWSRWKIKTSSFVRMRDGAFQGTSILRDLALAPASLALDKPLRLFNNWRLAVDRLRDSLAIHVFGGIR